MRKPIKVDLNSIEIALEITISTQLGWNYIYDQEDRADIKCKSTSSPPPNSFPHTYTLGSPSELNLDVNNITIRIFNPTNDSSSYSFKVRWLQGEKQLTVWKKTLVTLKEHSKEESMDVFFIAI